jgi:hypothetical protein
VRALLILAVVVLVSPARAQTKEECLEAYTRSQPLRRDGKLGDARKALLICARDPCPKQLQPDCVEWLEDVEKSIPSLVLEAKDAEGRDLANVRVFLDDRPLATVLHGRALELDPGSHVLRFEHGGRTLEQTVVVQEGDKQRRVSVTFPPTERTPAREISRARPPASASPPAVAIGLGALGLVALGSFAYFGTTGVSERSDLEECKPNCETKEVKSVDRKFWIANVSLAVAALSLGGATYLFVSSSGSQQTNVGLRTTY